MSNIVESIDNALDDWSMSGDAMRWTPEPPRPRVATGVATVIISVDTSSFVEAMRQVAATMSDLHPKLERLRQWVRGSTRAAERRGLERHQPIPLSIDGREYRRRSRRR